MSDRTNLNNARKAKNNEFYTRYEDIEKELDKYKDYFRGKTIYLPCDDPDKSNFTKYFLNHFNELNLKQLISTGYNANGHGKCLKIGIQNASYELMDNGDFRSDECTAFRDEADIIITNPPFSLFRDFFKWVINKKFLIIGSIVINTYKEIFPYWKDLKFWLDSELTHFITEDNNIKLISCGWYTNIGNYPNKDFIQLTKSIKDTKYESYDHYPNIINIDKLADIPYDYDGLMGIPSTVIRKYNPKQFEIINILKNSYESQVNNQHKFTRIVVKRVPYEKR